MQFRVYGPKLNHFVDELNLLRLGWLCCGFGLGIPEGLPKHRPKVWDVTFLAWSSRRLNRNSPNTLRIYYMPSHTYVHVCITEKHHCQHELASYSLAPTDRRNLLLTFEWYKENPLTQSLRPKPKAHWPSAPPLGEG